MKIFEAHKLLQTIKEVQEIGGNFPVKFSFCLAKNVKLLQAEIEIAASVINNGVDTGKLQEFEQTRHRMLSEKAKKNEDGSAAIENGSYVFDSPKTLEAIIKKLEKDFPDVAEMIFRQNAQSKEVEQQECDVVLHKLPLSDWPDIPAKFMNDMLLLVNE